MRLRLATRGSPLALVQSRWTAARLTAYGHAVELVTVKTSGDALPHDRWESEGTKGLFVKEIEEALVAGTADLAVHSSKDLPADLPPGLVIAAYPEREDARDVLVSQAGLEALGPGAVVGTASARRRMQLALLKSDLVFLAIRGNVDTRLRKFAEGACAALVLAAAGLRRLGRADVSFETFETAEMVPAPGQGALAVECRADRAELLQALKPLDHDDTRAAVECERLFMRAMGGGCRMPLGAYARFAGGAVEMDVFYAATAEGKGVRAGGRRPRAEAAVLVDEMIARVRGS